MFETIRKTIFGEGEKRTKELGEISKIFAFLKEQINREDLTRSLFAQYKKIPSLSRINQDNEYARCYLLLEEFILANKPIVIKKKFTRDELRQEITTQMKVELLPIEIRLLFLNKSEQLYYLYKTKIAKPAQYLIRSLGTDNVSKALKNSTLTRLNNINADKDGFNFEAYEHATVLSSLSLEDVHLDFKALYGAVYEEIAKHVGEAIATNLFAMLFADVKRVYNYDLVSRFLDLMPLVIQDKEKISLLSRQQLEQEVIVQTHELAEEKTKVEQKVIERTKELQTEKDKLDVVTQNMFEGVILLDKQMNVLFVNRQMKDILEPISKESKDVLEKFHIFSGTNPRDIFSATMVPQITKIDEIDKGANIYDVSFSVIQSVTKEAVSEYFVIWLRNITQFKLLERAKSEFVSVAAHQLRTPLSGIKWTLNMLIKGDLGALNDEQKTFMLKTYEGNERMIELVNDLLNVEKMSQRLTEYSFRDSNIFDVIQNIFFDLAVQLKSKNIAVKIEPNSAPLISVDPDKMKLAFQNLIENAIKYIIKDGAITVAGKKLSDNIEITIADTGIGIPKDQQANIFKRFYRASNAVKLQTEGSGLGLYLAKTIIEHHGGSLRFQSEENKGTTFFITLPIHKKA